MRNKVSSSKTTVASGSWPDPPIPDLDASGLMHPPWLKYPNLLRTSAGWRMGQGEAYLNQFKVWWSRQARATRVGTKAKYPELAEWSGYWASL